MVKYTDTQVVFEEIPDEITLAINISNCPHHCKGCHSPYLREDIGTELTEEELERIVKDNEGVTCVAFMGEGNDLEGLVNLAVMVSCEFDLKTAIYSGSEDLPERFWWDFDYIKLGPYDEERGPINKPTTNQRMYEHVKYVVDKSPIVNGVKRFHWIDITDRFWKGRE